MISAVLIDSFFLEFPGMLAIGGGVIIIGFLIGIMFDDPFGISVLVSVGVAFLYITIGSIYKYEHPIHNICDKCTYIINDSLLEVTHTYPDGSPKVIVQTDYKRLKPECPNAKEGERIDFDHKYITSVEVKTLPFKN